MKINNFFYLLLFLAIYSCNSETSEKQKSVIPKKTKISKSGKVVVHELSDPDKLNPINSQGAGATYIEHNIFMYLLDVDKSYKWFWWCWIQ